MSMRRVQSGMPRLQQPYIPARHCMVKLAVVNGGAIYFLPAAKCESFRDFAYKSAIQKVR
jgi:hypothetical protein